MKAGLEEIRTGADQIGRAMNMTFFWHENFSTLARVLGKNQVTTNVGIWVFYGMAEPQVVGTRGSVQITAAKPTSYHLIVSSEVPTSRQKVMILDLLATEVAKRLGAPANAVTTRSDPTREKKEEGKLVGVGGAAEHGLLNLTEADAYKNIRDPYVISITWPASEEDARWRNRG